MTPWLAFTISLVYCIASDGEVDEEENGYLLTALGGEDVDEATVGVARRNRAALEEAISYCQSFSVEEFLEQARPLLTAEQRLCILLNMADCALSDGEAEPEEQDLIIQFQVAFGISDLTFGPLLQALIIKNDKQVFPQ